MIAVAAVDVRSGRRHERDAHLPVPAASTIKVLVSAALWSGACAGRIDPERRVRAGAAPVPGGGGLLESMHPETELTLAELDLLMLAVSDNAATNALIDAVGMDAVNDLAGTLGLGHTRLRRRMMDIIPRYLPAASSRVVSSKRGELDAVRHDVALVDEGERRIAIAVLSPPAAAAEGLARTAALAYRLVAAPVGQDD